MDAQYTRRDESKLLLSVTGAAGTLLDETAQEMLSPAGVALLERKVREHIRNRSKVPAVSPKVRVAKKQAEIEQLRGLMKSGTLSQAVAQAAIAHAEGSQIRVR